VISISPVSGLYPGKSRTVSGFTNRLPGFGSAKPDSSVRSFPKSSSDFRKLRIHVGYVPAVRLAAGVHAVADLVHVFRRQTEQPADFIQFGKIPVVGLVAWFSPRLAFLGFPFLSGGGGFFFWDNGRGKVEWKNNWDFYRAIGPFL
jgi:hypothetical protein